jgi:ABC-type glutathione transport system ATPase component
VGVHGSNFTDAERQHLALARAILKKPKMLILDEAMSSMGKRNEAEILKTLKALDEELKGVTVIRVPAWVSMAKRSDIIMVLRKGKMVEEGSHDDLLAKNGEYAQLLKHEQENTKFRRQALKGQLNAKRVLAKLEHIDTLAKDEFDDLDEEDDEDVREIKIMTREIDNFNQVMMHKACDKDNV